MIQVQVCVWEFFAFSHNTKKLCECSADAYSVNWVKTIMHFGSSYRPHKMTLNGPWVWHMCPGPCHTVSLQAWIINHKGALTEKVLESITGQHDWQKGIQDSRVLKWIFKVFVTNTTLISFLFFVLFCYVLFFCFWGECCWSENCNSTMLALHVRMHNKTNRDDLQRVSQPSALHRQKPENPSEGVFQQPANVYLFT